MLPFLTQVSPHYLNGEVFIKLGIQDGWPVGFGYSRFVLSRKIGLKKRRLKYNQKKQLIDQ